MMVKNDTVLITMYLKNTEIFNWMRKGNILNSLSLCSSYFRAPFDKASDGGKTSKSGPN